MKRARRHDRTRQSRYEPADGAGIVNPRASQRALCVGVSGPGEAQAESDGLGELKELLRTAGVAVAGELVQQRRHAEPNVYLGKGKIQELRRAIGERDANLIACDDELAPRQERNLEEATGLPVIDRTAIILDIFSDHAGSAEGKLQTELAQLEYNLARMRGLWTHLERLGGGIGTRGPGETQIETDRRLARNRIAQLKRRLARVERNHRLMRQERERTHQPTIAVAGYTNAGKSTLVNALADATIDVGERLFETVDPTTRSFRHEGRTYLVTDTVGFIRKLPHQLVEAFRGTLEETRIADVILHVVDASVPEDERDLMSRAAEDVLEEIGAGANPRLLVLNKADLLSDEERRRLKLRSREAVLVSAETGEGLDRLRRRIELVFRESLEVVELLVPYESGDILSQLHELAGDLERRDTGEGVYVSARVPSAVAERLRRFDVDGRHSGDSAGDS